MAKPRTFDAGPPTPTPKPAAAAEAPPRLPAAPMQPSAVLAAPVMWRSLPAPPTAAGRDAPPPSRGLLRSVGRALRFWRRSGAVVQASVFGPPAVAPGQAVQVLVFVHSPKASAAVATLARAFHHEAELLGTGRTVRGVPKGATIALHLAVANAGLSKSMVSVTWQGQPYSRAFDLFVPWESPAGPSPAVLSVGHDGVRVGVVDFQLRIRPRTG